MASKPTVAMVLGAWHLPSPALDPVIALLNKAGYATVPITLPSVGSPATAVDDITAIRAAVVPLVEEQGKEVVLVMHSYGGLIGTEAIKGLARTVREKDGKAGGVVRLVYMAAMLPTVGETGMDALRRHLANGLSPNVSAMAPSEMLVTDDGMLHHLTGVERFYNDIDPETATALAKLLKPQSFVVFNTRLTYPAYQDIPSAYLVCMKDQSIAWESQEAMAKEAGCDMIEKVQSGHTPTIVMPDVVVSFLRRAAGEKL